MRPGLRPNAPIGADFGPVFSPFLPWHEAR
jgi:hypothetical protein